MNQAIGSAYKLKETTDKKSTNSHMTKFHDTHEKYDPQDRNFVV